MENNPALQKLSPHIRGNVGFMFTKEDLTEIRDILLANKVSDATCAGGIAPPQNTGLGPEKTLFFQDLGITTRISRGTTEILSDVQMFNTGDKVGASEANHAEHLPLLLWDDHPETLHSRFMESVRSVASVRLQIGYLTIASVTHSTIKRYKQVLALSVVTDYTFPLAEKVKTVLADPSAFVATAPVATTTTAAPAAAAAPAKAEAKEESQESDKERGFGLFH
ncbi:hypothetical protein GH733_009155 [Mirounga leonina]|nr:hypothetical protein GH733_009155 [Mirounga leonina]